MRAAAIALLAICLSVPAFSSEKTDKCNMRSEVIKTVYEYRYRGYSLSSVVQATEDDEEASEKDKAMAIKLIYRVYDEPIYRSSANIGLAMNTLADKVFRECMQQ